MEKSWKEAIKRVLKESTGPLHYKEISERILSQGYYETDGATPTDTVNAQITSSIKHEGEKSPFIRVGRGIFTLKDLVDSLVEFPETGEKSTNGKLLKQERLGKISESDIESSEGHCCINR